MPGLDGFGVLDQVGLDRVPAVIFVTAYDRYALRELQPASYGDLDVVLKNGTRLRASRRYAKGLREY